MNIALLKGITNYFEPEIIYFVEKSQNMLLSSTNDAEGE